MKRGDEESTALPFRYDGGVCHELKLGHFWNGCLSLLSTIRFRSRLGPYLTQIPSSCITYHYGVTLHMRSTLFQAS